MKQSHFTVEGSTSLTAIPRTGRIHIVGVCGVAMAPLAVALCEQGYTVSGSDKAFYEPMGSLLRSVQIELMEGHKAENIPAAVDLVVFANRMFYDSPEVMAVQTRALPYTSFPQIVGEILIGDRHAIVSCGTHGKSTTTAMIASVLHRAGEDPSYFIGGIAGDLPRSLHVGAGPFAVIEGDEYHSAFYARVPKFTFYSPRTCLINAIELDHTDLYPTVAHVVDEFRRLLTAVPAEGKAICCTDYAEVRALLAEENSDRRCRVVTFGSREDADYRLVARKPKGCGQQVEVATVRQASLSLEVPVMGDYNALNAVACLAALTENGFDPAIVQRHLKDFVPVQRRQQLRLTEGGITLMEDFAHHPTAVAGTVRAARESFPGRRLWAVFEPRSNTSRRKVFEAQYVRAFDEADRVILADVGRGESRMNDDVELIDIGELAEAIAARGTPARTLPDPGAIQAALLAEATEGDVILLMSNGAFGGLPARLEAALRSRLEKKA